MRLNKLKRNTEASSKENSSSSSKKILQLSNRLLSLKQIANVLGSTLEVKKVLTKICEACEKLLKAKSVSIYFISGKSLVLKNRMGKSTLPDKIEINEKEGELVKYLSKNYIMSSAAIKDDSVINGIYSGSKFNFKISGFLGSEKEKMGILLIEEMENSDIDDSDIQLFSILLNLASLSIRNALLYQKVKKLANQDGLTKLFTKRYFDSYMKLELARSMRHKKKFSIIMSDIDHFKNFNDEHGHQAGDYVLEKTALIFQQTVRFTDLVSRYGGEEFIIVLPETDLEGAYIVSEKIRTKLESTILTFEGKELSVRVSLGISTYPDHGEVVKDLIKLCDNCLYHAKKTGRNKTVKYSSEIKNVDD
jgi:diguanylate cyclase (GGDEF)-like protein